MSDFPRRPSFVAENVERRTGVRGPVKGLRCALPAGRSALVLEAGRRGVFIEVDDPDSFALGARLDVVISGPDGNAAARVDVVRKEIDPRRGIALLIVHMSPAAEETYLAWLEA
jgi:hypothetical protein